MDIRCPFGKGEWYAQNIGSFAWKNYTFSCLDILVHIYNGTAEYYQSALGQSDIVLIKNPPTKQFFGKLN